ncbi:FMN-binding protein [Sporolactobacillus laevolacticus]|uniref:FMN-binding protein n=1 Tax=Sporolactobacillus laevolacticus TaxID=33018 RepID=UPI0025B4F100|nr:FMN-binding protein [Sporolactobacillus laevolacticus]MDN3953583.1 FMN-binding protein [Sporolactobacillus laevolacticus]
MSKLNNKWVILCTAAIGLTYSAGYAVTNTDASNASVKGYSQTSIQQNNQKTYSNSTQSGNSNSSSSTSQSNYKNGTYTGQGECKFGAVAVKVTIKQGKINAVEITDCTTSYPESAIEGLPQEVVDRQGTDVDNVSGATFSTETFKTAVINALEKAKG